MSNCPSCFKPVKRLKGAVNVRKEQIASKYKDSIEQNRYRNRFKNRFVNTVANAIYDMCEIVNPLRGLK